MTRIRVRVPPSVGSLLTFGDSGDQANVMTDAAGRYADILEDDARLILFSGLPASVAWRELNPGLSDMLGRPQRQYPGHRIVDLQQQAVEQARPNPFDKVSIVRQSLAMFRRAR